MKEKRPPKLADLLNANSIAIVGASSDSSKVSGRPLSYMLKSRFKGKLFPVNPGREEVQGLKSYKSLRDIGQPIDLAIIGTSASQVSGIVKEGIEVGVKTFVVFSSGFAEVGGEGAAMQEELSQLAKTYGARILGPNCLGAANSSSGLIASFTTAMEETTLQSGHFGFISQSGALGAYWLDLVLRTGIGFSQWITTGNECDIEAAEALEFLIDDPATQVIGLYLEDIRDTFAFRNALKRAAIGGKPVIAIKSGCSEAGSKAAASHTGALAGDDSLYDACLEQYGALRVESFSAMMNLAKLFLFNSVPSGNRLAVLSVSGGAGVLIADKADAVNLSLPGFSEKTCDSLRDVIPDFSTPNNPLDLTGNVVQDAASVSKALAAVADDPSIDGIVLFVGLMHSIADQITESLIRARQNTKQPIVLVWIGAKEETLRLTEAAKIPTFQDIPEAIEALSDSIRLCEIQANARTAPIIQSTAELQADGSETITEWSAKQLLQSQDYISIPKSFLLSPGETVSELPVPPPVVAKIQSTQLLHKSDAGGVILKIDTPDKLNSAISALESKATELNLNIQGILIEQMANFDHELVLGLRRDPKFGHVLTLGRGGVEIELDPDVSTKLLPVNADQVEAMILSLRSAKLFQGFRGKAGIDVLSLATKVSALSDWFMEETPLTELEINPLAVKGSDVWALDALASTTDLATSR